ncbi:DUF2946 family protein [Chitinivorax sp. PXF-14]|uniref:DUF2946 family protein n=1 Tax=Chitinivorax sp. PXF-14 TaxID=3230488 RepID=UPI0034671A48
MDDIVLQAMAKWPNVPAVYGWLRLDRRGHWWIREERLSHAGLAEFIGRNYARAENGDYYFQNGPQKVFVELESTPWIYRLADGVWPPAFVAHDGQPISPHRAVIDDDGRLYLVSEQGLGVVDERDLVGVMEHLRDGEGRILEGEQLAAWMDGSGQTIYLHTRGGMLDIEYAPAAALPVRYGFNTKPVA